MSPAILIDCGHYLEARQAVGKEAGNPSDNSQLLQEVIFSYVVPQLDDLSRSQLQEVVYYLQTHVLTSHTLGDVARLLASAVQASPEDLIPTKGIDSAAVGNNESGSDV
jgi:hypothetical protein